MHAKGKYHLGVNHQNEITKKRKKNVCTAANNTSEERGGKGARGGNEERRGERKVWRGWMKAAWKSKAAGLRTRQAVIMAGIRPVCVCARVCVCVCACARNELRHWRELMTGRMGRSARTFLIIRALLLSPITSVSPQDSVVTSCVFW